MLLQGFAAAAAAAAAAVAAAALAAVACFIFCEGQRRGSSICRATKDTEMEGYNGKN